MQINFKYVLFCSTSILLSLTALSQDANDILGTWMTQEGKGEIEIYRKQGTDFFYGKIVWLKDPKDENGKPIKDAKGTPVLNLVNLKDFVFDDGEWVDGTIYDPESGDTYYCTIEMENYDKLKVRGSIDPMGWIGKTKYWDRVK
ncbi:DUF2147 domain-containing protein [Cryomorpha ignava]|uniref:DUF2147 domain-containing protein n=1 Tax=Cryomorpha ignava TaxID=101383 RepID=A0A7K3WLV3_9FLAO|nr:DUF2147 domain-containing protein [Cryomorpha ignava]NEN22630.1 DUF2147 domain-containing protein [Cryomorpha ignava]